MSNSQDSLRDRLLPGGAPVLSKRVVLAPLSTLAFWSAIALPALYLPLLATGLNTPRELLVFLGLFAVHVLTLLAGQSHRRD